MPVKLSDRQLAFYQELFAPFPDGLLSTTKRGGKELTYVDKRAITNRLDSVVGPHGWRPEYEATARGYKCRLYIKVPTARDTGVDEQDWEWLAKEDGAGFEEMGSYNKSTNEWEADVDNDEKSGYTNALRRAAQDAWGIGRYLYRKGIPTFLDPNATAPGQGQPSPSGVNSDRRVEPPQDRPAPPPRPEPTKAADPAPAKTFDNFKIPKPGKQVFFWAKEMEKSFETRLVDGMKNEGEERGWGGSLSEWNDDQVKAVCMGVIDHLRGLPTYKGQYDYLFQSPGTAPAKTPPPVAPGVNVADLRKLLVAKMSDRIQAELGRTPTQTDLKAAFLKIASIAATGGGEVGVVPESLNSLTDAVWLKNMIDVATHAVASGNAETEEIPF